MIFFCKDFFVYKGKRKKVRITTQEELRELYRDRLKAEKQVYIAEKTGINPAVLSQFKNARIDLYDYLFKKLEAYLTVNN